MNIKHILLIIAIGLSPIWVTWLLPALFMINLSKMRMNDVDVLGVYALMWVVCMPLTFIIGLINSYVVRKKPNAQRLTLVGYAVPAVIFCVLFILQVY